MRFHPIFLPVLLLCGGCAAPSATVTARYNLWRGEAASPTYGCKIATGTSDTLATMVRTSMASAGMYEDFRDDSVVLSTHLGISQPRLTQVERWSGDWQTASEERRFVELIDRDGRPVVVRATHPEAYRARRCAVMLSRSTLVLEATRDGRRLWCAEIVLIAPEDRPEQLSEMLQPAVAEVLTLAQGGADSSSNLATAIAAEDRLVASTVVGESR